MTTTATPRFSSIGTAWMSDSDWKSKLDSDARTIAARFPAHLRDLHSTVVSRAESGGGEALILSGSTARARRTEISDLDYHLIGPEIYVKDLSRELDIHTLDNEKLVTEIHSGDDFVQWSLRFGLVVFDSGVVRQAHQLIAVSQQWPDWERKRKQAEKSVDLARRFVGTGDADGALEQVRTALTLAARAYLLANGDFPLSRAELPDQLSANGQPGAADALNATIFEALSLEALADAVSQAYRLLHDIGTGSQFRVSRAI
jgi:hypothetical protein